MPVPPWPGTKAKPPGKEDDMFFALAVGAGLFAGGVLAFARWRGEVAVRRERAAADGRQPRGSLRRKLSGAEEQAEVRPRVLA